MQFIVSGYDGKDAGAMERRLAVREKHLQLAKDMKEEGRLLFAAALLDDDGQMIGSVLMMDFTSREALDQWLSVEPYVTGNVWQEIEVKVCQIPPMFLA